MYNFSNTHSIEARKKESSKILLKYPTRIPIIVEKSSKCDLMDIDKKKYLVPKDLLMSQFVYVIRKRIKLNESHALFVMVDRQLVRGNTPIGDIYDTHCNEDGFIYMIYTSENTFG